MNKIQEKSLELLVELTKICDKWNIPYFLVSGTALGAVKYRGFIPWDDDIDVAMLRRDYELFLSIAQSELPEWCFLQNYRTDPRFTQMFSKLRNKNTTFIEWGVQHLPINHGLYIDIFPIDGVPERRAEKGLFFLKRKLYSWIIYSGSAEKQDTKIRVKVRNRILRFFGFHKRTAAALEKLEKLCKTYPPESSMFWSGTGSFQGAHSYMPKAYFGDGIWAEFEGIRVRVPEDYDAYFTHKYGNWREELPKERQKSHHICVVCDTERPYTYYVRDK